MTLNVQCSCTFQHNVFRATRTFKVFEQHNAEAKQKFFKHNFLKVEKNIAANVKNGEKRLNFS